MRIINRGPFLQDNWDDDDDEKKEEAEVKPGEPLGFLHFWFSILVSISVCVKTHDGMLTKLKIEIGVQKPKHPSILPLFFSPISSLPSNHNPIGLLPAALCLSAAVRRGQRVWPHFNALNPAESAGEI